MSPVNAKVILVEDNISIVESAVTALENAGHHVLFTARDSQTANTLLQERKDKNLPIDVALVDGNFPELPDGGKHYNDQYRGGELASRVRDLFPETTIVVFSTDEKKRFSKHRFPPQGKEKSLRTIEEDLGPFVTSLPPAARK